jgi:stringent starvation protein B
MSFQTKFGGVSSKIQMPFAQVCQIVNLEGRHFYENTEIAPSASEIIKMLDGEFERIYEDTSDMWDINLKDINPQSVYLRKPR